MMMMMRHKNVVPFEVNGMFYHLCYIYKIVFSTK